MSGSDASKHQVIAIDGPAASGKSTVSRRLAARLGFVYVNSGEMYRAVTWGVLDKGIAPDDAETVWETVQRMKIECALNTDENGDSISVVTIDGVDPGDALRSQAVNAAVSAVSSVPEVRKLLVARQRDYAKVSDIVMEGRDIGSVVFPDTPHKFFITASEEVRNARRAAEGHTDPISARDKQDSSRKASPLVLAEGAIEIDTSELNIDEVLDKVESLLNEKGFRANA